jgi:hypothetical protein
LVLPIITSALGLYVLGQAHDQTTAANYIRDNIRAVIAEEAGDPDVFTWESYFREHKDLGYATQAAALSLLFPGIALGSSVGAAFHPMSAAEWTVWVLGLLVAMLFSGVSAYIHRGRIMHFYRMARRSPGEASA